MERDCNVATVWIFWQYFNSHAHVERDICSSTTGNRLAISTHTLTWSVTVLKRLQMRFCEFQLTRSRGAWLRHFTADFLHCNFNSHAHVERDVGNLRITTQLYISTHTLTWSVTENDSWKLTNGQFQLTRSRGAWQFVQYYVTVIYKFQLTRSRGAWLTSAEMFSYFVNISTHTLTWSVTW